MAIGTNKLQCHCCNKYFNKKPLKHCRYHFCNECIYLWITNCIFDTCSYKNHKYKEIRIY